MVLLLFAKGIEALLRILLLPVTLTNNFMVMQIKLAIGVASSHFHLY